MLTLTPYLIVDDGNAAIAFYEQALGAKCPFRMPGEDGKRLINARIEIGPVAFMLMDDFPEHVHPHDARTAAPKRAGGASATFHLHCDTSAEVDERVARAVKAGGKITQEPTTMFWGDYYGSIVDPFGHIWSFGATPGKAA
jgi:PhnB protein